jgi:serine/threonine protein kinase
MTGERNNAAPLRRNDPRQLGAYALLGRLGEGGMGTVYLGRHPDGRLVAVKMIRADLAPDDEFRRRFRSEVNRARQVPPFCTAEILDADPDHEQPYLVCEYVDAPSLADVVTERGPLTAANLHSVAIGVATALTAIHGAGVIHRDLKPENVLLAPGSPKVIDFGIARALEPTSGHTSTDQMVGTVAYMAPERFGPDSGTTLTPAADVFAWGSVVAYAGTGKTPFSADSPPATAARILTQPPDLTGLSGPLRDLVDRALAKDPADRPTARELLDLLITSPSRPAASASALADQPGLRAAAQEAQAQTGYDSARQLTALAVPSGLLGFDDDSMSTKPVVPFAPGPPPSPKRRWLLAVALAVVLGAGIGGATMAVSSWTTRTAPGPVVSPSLVNQAELITDDLHAPRLWQPSADDKLKAGCSFNQALVVRRPTPGSFRCKGPLDLEPDNLKVEVGARLVSAGSCAAVWLRFRNNTGYLVQVCEKDVLVCTHKGNKVEVLRTLPLDTAIPLGGAPTQISLTVSGDSLTILLDGMQIGPGPVPLDDPDMVSGRVALGLYTEELGGPARTKPYEVTFDHVSVRRL